MAIAWQLWWSSAENSSLGHGAHSTPALEDELVPLLEVATRGYLVVPIQRGSKTQWFVENGTSSLLPIFGCPLGTSLEVGGASSSRKLPLAKKRSCQKTF